MPTQVPIPGAKTSAIPTAHSYPVPSGHTQVPIPGKHLAKKPQHHGGGGFFDSVGHFFKQGATDIKDVAVNSPAGLYHVGDAVYRSILKPPPLRSKADEAALGNVASDTYHQIVSDLKHPLAHPGFTALDLLTFASGGAGAASRIVDAGRALKAGEGLSEATARAIRPPNPPSIVMRAGKLEAHTPASRAALSRYVQRAVNHLRNTYPEAPLGLQSQVTRVGKALEKQRRTDYSLVTGKPAYLQHAGRKIKLSSPQGAAMRAAAEGVPVEQRLAMHRADLAKAPDTVTRKHIQIQIRALEQAVKQGIVPLKGAPVLNPGKLPRSFVRVEKPTREETINRWVEEAARGHAAEAADWHRVVDLLNAGKLNRWDAMLTRQMVKTQDAPLPFDEAGVRARMVEYYDKHGPNSILPGGRRVVLSSPKSSPARVAALYDEVKQAALDHDAKLVETGLMSAEGAAQAIHNPGRLFSGASFETAHARPHPIPVQRDFIGNYSTPAVSVEEMNRLLPNDGEHLYHATSLENLEGIRQQGLVPGKERSGEVTGIYFAEDGTGVLSLQPVRRRGADVWLRVKRGAVPVGTTDMYAPGSGFNEFVTRNRVSRDSIEYLGADGRWHGLADPARPRLVGAEGFRGGQFHVGYERYQKPFSTFKPPQVGSSNTLRVAKREPPRFRKPLTGANLHQGMFRNDVPHIVAGNILEGERFLATQRAARFFEQHASDTPVGIKQPVAIATEELKHNPLPQGVKDFQQTVRQERQMSVQHKLGGVLYEDWRDRIFPKINPADYEAHPQVKWIDERLLGGLNKPNPLVGFGQHVSARRGLSVFDQINNATKAAILYLKPGYAAPNIIGNAFLTLTHQGPFAPANIARAVRLVHKLPEEDARMIDALMGEGLTGSLAAEAGVGAKAINKLAHVWGKVVDLPFRRASFLYEARKAIGAKPVKTPWREIHDLIHDEAKRPQLHEVTIRANRALIDYADLNPVEQAIIRRIVFFYPWLKGSSKYAAEYVRSHPVQAGVMGNLGQMGTETTNRELGPLPSWAEGYFKVGGTDANPVVVNPTAAGILGQPAQLAEILAKFAGTGHVPSAYQISNLLTPGLGAAGVAVGGYDPFTHKATEQNFGTFLNQFYQGQPLKALVERLTQDQSGRTFPLSHRDAWLQYLLGSSAPKPADKGKLNRAAAKDQLPPR